jgi:hypothetical protein
MSKKNVDIRIEQNDYYIDKNSGLFVFTESYHLKRGYCCKNNCRHCPYKKKRKNIE